MHYTNYIHTLFFVLLVLLEHCSLFRYGMGIYLGPSTTGLRCIIRYPITMKPIDPSPCKKQTH